LAKQFAVPYVDRRRVDIAKDVIDTVPKNVAVEHNIVPVSKSARTVRIAMADPLDFFTLDNLRFILNLEIECVLASRDAVRDAIAEEYGEIMDVNTMINGLGADDVDVRD